MATEAKDSSALELNRQFHEEYTADASVRKYVKDTAGYGISYLLDHDYGELYLETIRRYIPKERIRKGIRLWEFGCGGGMNLIHMVSLLDRHGMAVDCAYGTDFSAALIAEADREKNQYLKPELAQQVRFCVARNEDLIAGATKEWGMARQDLANSFDLVLGVNTIRYCHRLKTEARCAADIRDLLAPGGVCIVIDMNQKFPAFRARIHDKLTKDPAAYHLPSLSEYAQPFSSAGFEILRMENFCWVPHSAGRALTAVMKVAGPLLSMIAPNRAMRSLVVSRKAGAEDQ